MCSECLLFSSALPLLLLLLLLLLLTLMDIQKSPLLRVGLLRWVLMPTPQA